jgi:hypothetical protein
MASCDASADDADEGSGSEMATSSVPGSDDDISCDEGSKKSATPALQPRSSSRVSPRASDRKQRGGGVLEVPKKPKPTRKAIPPPFLPSSLPSVLSSYLPIFLRFLLD